MSPFQGNNPLWLSGFYWWKKRIYSRCLGKHSTSHVSLWYQVLTGKDMEHVTSMACLWAQLRMAQRLSREPFHHARPCIVFFPEEAQQFDVGVTEKSPKGKIWVYVIRVQACTPPLCSAMAAGPGPGPVVSPHPICARVMFRDWTLK